MQLYTCKNRPQRPMITRQNWNSSEYVNMAPPPFFGGGRSPLRAGETVRLPTGSAERYFFPVSQNTTHFHKLQSVLSGNLLCIPLTNGTNPAILKKKGVAGRRLAPRCAIRSNCSLGGSAVTSFCSYIPVGTGRKGQ